MKILLLFNSFKGTYSSREINEYLYRYLLKKGFNARYINISDGGDGFLDCFIDDCNVCRKKVTGPFYNRKVSSNYCLKNNESFIEISLICGIRYLEKKELSPLTATTYGVGEVIRDCVLKGAKNIYVGLGGTASSDGGFGMARALGARFLDKYGREIDNNLYGLLKLFRIDFKNFINLSAIKVWGISDVKNKLLGRKGSARIFGPQKGAQSKDIEVIEKALYNLKNVLEKQTGKDISVIEGGGAAGGLGSGLYGFLNAGLINGSDFIISRFDIKNEIKKSDLIISGEGKFDKSSFYGKITGEIINIATVFKKRLIFVSVYNEIKRKIDGVENIILSQNYSETETKKNLKKIIAYEIYNRLK